MSISKNKLNSKISWFFNFFQTHTKCPNNYNDNNKFERISNFLN